MQLQAAIQGDLQTLLKAELRGAERAVTVGVRVATLSLKTELRAQVTRAGMGTRLANTWRSTVYPEGQQSLGAAGFVWSKAPNLIRLYDEGAIIRSKQGLFLAIPTPAASAIAGRRSRPAPGSASCSGCSCRSRSTPSPVPAVSRPALTGAWRTTKGAG
jgi:Family of unknown function (DUF6441)